MAKDLLPLAFVQFLSLWDFLNASFHYSAAHYAIVVKH